ncbi:MAG TPA: peroxiredoxin [Mesorhizobium sp.]|jgi:peroxiredoxin|nr:peroxiredoxin [Mesorhizobium sp.]
MTIAVGEKLPSASFRIKTAEGVRSVNTEEFFGGRKVVLVGVPGAFTPTCSDNHLPGFLENAEALHARGVDEIAVVAVNDHHVMRAWEQASGAEGRIAFLADGNGEFTRAIGLDMDMSGGGLGVRARRFSMLVEDGVVRSLNLEEGRGVEATGAARMLEQV